MTKTHLLTAALAALALIGLNSCCGSAPEPAPAPAPYVVPAK